MRRIGLLGGTFDPPHIGHFIMAQEVKHKLNLEEVWFIPTNDPPHKSGVLFSAGQRCSMLQQAVESTDTYRVETIELQREGKSYTVDTILELQEQHPDAEFYFIIGADMVEYLPKWHRIEELISLVTFVGVKRKDHSLSTSYSVITVDMPVIEISSTEIKKRLKKREEVKYFLPHEVYMYIKELLDGSENSR